MMVVSQLLTFPAHAITNAAGDSQRRKRGLAETKTALDVIAEDLFQSRMISLGHTPPSEPSERSLKGIVATEASRSLVIPSRVQGQSSLEVPATAN